MAQGGRGGGRGGRGGGGRGGSGMRGGRGGMRGGRGGGGGGGRRDKDRPEAITFDDEARSKYLTTFHKRKMERRGRAKQELEEMQREARRHVRKQRREGQDESVRKWEELHGITLPEVLGINEEAPAPEDAPADMQYDTGDQITTVTTINDIDLDGEDDDLNAAAAQDDDEEEEQEEEEDDSNVDYAARARKIQRKLAQLSAPKRLKGRSRSRGGKSSSKSSDAGASKSRSRGGRGRGGKR